MKVQIIKKDIEIFNLKDIFECGQCFRWKQDKNGGYTGVFHHTVLNVRIESENNKYKTVVFKGVSDDNLENQINEYFDFNCDYKKLQNELSKVDENLKTSIEYGKGIRLLNQDLWETIISFIISANNNIPRIQKIIENICRNYGDKIEYNENIYYTFPRPEKLKDVTIEQYRNMGTGFRDKYIKETVRRVCSGEFSLENLQKLETTYEMRQALLTLPGVGPKVADCILLFSTLKRLDVFPIDVWVRRVMNELYINEEDETKVSKLQIEKIAKEKFGDLEGLAQQYLFYWKREA